MKLSSISFNTDYELLHDAFENVCKYSCAEIIITDKNFNILFQNSRYLFKNNRFDISNLTPNFFNESFKTSFENFKNSTKSHMLLKLIFNGENNLNNIPMDVHICKIMDKENRHKGYSVIIQDISNEIKNRLQKETFIDILNHDLKNPMRANIRILELILNNKFGVLNDSLKSVLDELLSSCKLMNYMADNLLIKYKNESNLYELQKQKHSIVHLVREKCNNLSTIFDKKNQTLEFIVKGDIKDLSFDVNEIGKVVNNLIINACEQSSENAKITVQIENNNDNVDVSFIDYGYPMKNEYLDEIFEEFITCSNKFRKIGFSLELYNCRKIIEAHNGIIKAQNANNTGTKIMFSLPMCV